MDFFTKQDFEYYESVIGSTYKSGTSYAKVLKLKLTQNGVFDKTKYWAQLLELEGYPIKSINAWQDYLKVRRYTWARIYLEGYKYTNVYFTIGVGSILTGPNEELCLVIKLDCQRKKGDLSAFQIQAFDNYRDTYLSNDWIIHIEKSELKNTNWESLKNKTLVFIKRNEGHYKNLVNALWPNGLGIVSKVARLCWNDLGWEKPSGLEGKSENTDHTFESKGYGHEEWLFNFDHGIDGYQYGFVQAFNRGDHFGKTYDLHLYTLKREGNKSNCYWVGRIKYAQVLTKEEQKAVYQLYKNQGWYLEMMNELKEVDVEHRDLEIVSEEELFNVKFKIDSDSFTRFEEPKFIENPKEEISKGYSRYNLKDLITTTATVVNTSNKYKFKPGHNPTNTGNSKSIYSKKIINRTLKHKEIQEFMYKQLTLLYGMDNVGTEVSTGRGTSIDVVIVLPDKSEWFYEVKTYNEPLVCIREAFGQILEYSMFSNNEYANKLVVVGINKPGKSEIEYLTHLRNTINLNIFYQVFSLKEKLLVDQLY